MFKKKPNMPFLLSDFGSMCIFNFLIKVPKVLFLHEICNLQAFTQTFKGSKPASLLKLACLSAIEDMLTPVS
jgi:hypothetical protein